MPRIIAPNRYWGTGEADPAYFRPSDIVQATLDGKHDTISDLQYLLDVDARVRALLEEGGCSVVASDEVDGEKCSDDYLLYSPINKADQINALGETLPSIPQPKTVNFADFQSDPFFPVVVKHISGEAGLFQFLLENERQWRLFEKFVRTMNAIGPTEEVESMPIDENLYLFQQFIETPSSHYTSFRTLVSYSGEILASGLFYSRHKKNTKKMEHQSILSSGEPHDMLLDPSMPPFLDATDHRSNLAREGICLPLKRDIRRPEQEEILREHGINPENPVLPKDLQGHIQDIARTHGRQWGAMLAIDFIRSSEDGTHYFLEANPDGDTMLYYQMHRERFHSKADAHVALYREVFRDLLREN